MKSREILDKIEQIPEIKAYICNSIGHPMYGGLQGIRKELNTLNTKPDNKMYRVLTITDFHSIHNKGELNKTGDIVGTPLGSLSEWERTCKQIIDQFVERGIVGFKELYLYFRTYHINMPNKNKAEIDFNNLLSGNEATPELQDY